MKLNLNLTRIFYHVVNAQSFTLAAEQLFTSQPAVSKAIKELESQLDLILINRKVVGSKTHKGIQLTDDGKALFEHARVIFSLEKAAVEDLQIRSKLRKGKLLVGASSTIASYWLAKYLTQFHQAYPAIELNVKAGNTDFIKQALIDCEIDLGIVEGEIDDNRITKTLWQKEELYIITPPNMQLKINNLDQQLWLLREKGSGTRNVVETLFEKLSIHPKHYLTIASNEGIARMVACGTGISILPKCIVEDLIILNKISVFKPLNTKNLFRPLYLITLKDRPISKLHQSFINYLGKDFKNE